MLAAATVSDNCKPGSAAVWINALWFASLVLSLSSASIGIVIRQWLNYFTSATPTTGKQDVYIHCLRWDKGVISWRVPELMAILPILLQLALTLFFIGLVILLWTLNKSVAIVTTVFVSAVLGFLVFSTVVPAWSPYCPYKSPQALLVHTTAHWVMRRIDSIWKTLAAISANAADSWAVREICWLRDGLTRFSGYTQELHRRPETLYRNWASLEQAVVKPAEGDNPHHKTMSWIEDHIFACGHVLLMDEVLLSEVVPTCLMDFNEVFDEDTAARHALKRLQCVFECDQPLSKSMHASLATLAATNLPADAETAVASMNEAYIWDIMPHIVDGGGGAVAAALRHLANHSAVLPDVKFVTPSEKETIVERLMEIAIGRDGPRQMWTENEPLQDVDHEYLAYIIRIISERVLGPSSASRAERSGRGEGGILRRRVNACGLAAYLARSLPTSYFLDTDNSEFFEHLTSLLRHVGRAGEHVHLSADRRLQWHFDVLLDHLSHLLSTFDSQLHPALATATQTLNVVRSLRAARRNKKEYRNTGRL